nr:hypothetical protein Iba_chr10aCG14830 [Ipomoea batatas]
MGCNSRTIRKYHRMNIDSEIQRTVICRRIITPICIQKPRYCVLEHRKEIKRTRHP